MLSKETLYSLLNQYMQAQINTLNFCDQFSMAYDLETDHDEFSNKERELFGNLSIYIDRYSPFEEDFLKFPGVYHTEKEIQEKAKETAKLLGIIK